MAAHSTDLNRQNLIWNLLPSLVFTLILGSYFLATRVAELDTRLERDAITLVQAYQHAASQALDSGDKNKAQALCNHILEHHDVRSVIIYSPTGEIIAQSGPAMLPLAGGATILPEASRNQAYTRSTEGSLRSLIRAAARPDGRNGIPQIQGWLEIELEPSNILIEKYRSGVFLLLGIFMVIALNGLVALRFSRKINQAVANARTMISHMMKEDLHTTTPPIGHGTLLALQTDLEMLRRTLVEGHMELHQSVEQRTADLRETLETIEIQNIELDMARKEALEASRIKSEFLANMSHEIRTPLNGVIGFTNLLLRSDISPFQRDYLETILKSSESLLAIINDILDFSKIEAGKLVLDSIPLNLQALVEDVLTMLAPLAYEKHLEQISLYYSDVPQHIIGDPLRLRQIITNLVNNAIKFTLRGEVVVRVMLEDLRSEYAMIRISVTDTGVGLSSEQQAALFNAFQQADNTTARKFGGTGLGLVISKHLVEQMRGKIGIDSEEGKGSTFWFTFRADLHGTEHPLQPLLSFPAKIALYDSNATLRSTLSNLMGSRRLDVSEFADLNALTVALGSRKFDVVLLGVNPETPHYTEMVQTLQDWQGRIPILLLGNPVDRHVIEEMLGDCPPPIFVPKPVEESCLRDGLRRALQPANNPLPAQTRNIPLDPGLHLLVVDDNTANLKLLSALIADLGIAATSCESGARALEAVATKRFDLILMDIQMPVMDGVETTRRIRALEEGRYHTPIIAVTAHAMANEKRNLLQAGLDDYVTKPINENHLVHILRKWTGLDLEERLARPQPVIHKPATGEVVDMEMGARLANGNTALAEEMFSMLLDSLLKDQPALNAMHDQQQFAPLLEAVHKLHGATRYTGVPALQQAARELEENLKLKQYPSTPPLMVTLDREISRVLDWGRQHRPDVMNALLAKDSASAAEAGTPPPTGD